MNGCYKPCPQSLLKSSLYLSDVAPIASALPWWLHSCRSQRLTSDFGFGNQRPHWGGVCSRFVVSHAIQTSNIFKHLQTMHNVLYGSVRVNRTRPIGVIIEQWSLTMMNNECGPIFLATTAINIHGGSRGREWPKLPQPIVRFSASSRCPRDKKWATAAGITWKSLWQPEHGNMAMATINFDPSQLTTSRSFGIFFGSGYHSHVEIQV